MLICVLPCSDKVCTSTCFKFWKTQSKNGKVLRGHMVISVLLCINRVCTYLTFQKALGNNNSVWRSYDDQCFALHRQGMYTFNIPESTQ